MNEQRLVEIETKLAYQEDTILQLNDAISSQQQQIANLETLSKHLVERLKELAEDGIAGENSIEKPPHY